MNFDYMSIVNRIVEFSSRFKYLLLGAAVVATLLIAVVRINQHSGVAINQERYDEQLLTVKRVSFDQDVIQRILDLKDLNVDIKSIFPDSRSNPFN